MIRIIIPFLLVISSLPLLAEPYLATRSGQKCQSCHVSPTGGGMRTAFGLAYGRSLAANEKLLTSLDPVLSDSFSIGADFRGSARSVSIPGQEDQFSFETERASIYLNAELLPERLHIYLDQQLSPGSENREAWLLYRSVDRGWYTRAGQFFLPYGLRLEDDSAFIRQVSGINFSSADNGIEIGFDKNHWSTQLAISNGSAGAAETNTDKQVSLRSVYVQSNWRAGGSLNHNESTTVKREMFNLFTTINLFSAQWLFEIDQIKDTQATSVTQQVFFAEVNKEIRKGHNLKLTVESHDPNTDVDEDERTRNSLIWEYFPVQQAQIRSGVRMSEGIPQRPQDNADLVFIELHAWF